MVRCLDAEGLLAKQRVKRNLNTSSIGYNLKLTVGPWRKLYLAARAVKNEFLLIYMREKRQEELTLKESNITSSTMLRTK